MALGSGKYDDLCTIARKSAEAEGALLIILNGRLGYGFSAQLPFLLLATIPEILRDVAKQIEDSLPKA
jgi:hypothetical protein